MAPQNKSKVPKIGLPATAVLTGSALSGAMISLSAVMIPVLLDIDKEAAYLLSHWARLYHYGHIYMPAVCVGTVSLYVYTAFSKGGAHGKRYAAAAALTITMVPFTWLVMTSTNNTLFRLEELASAAATTSEVGLSDVKQVVVRWMWLHLARCIFPLVGAIVGLVNLLQEVGA